ncbi:MAG: FAD-binding oxidoreductase [Ekhidna sp.]
MSSKVSNWTNYPIVEGDLIEHSFSEAVAQEVMAEGDVIARGNGRCYGDASLGKKMLSTLKLNNILAFDKKNGVIHAQSGVLLEKILKLVVTHGWFLSVTPGTKFITVGGAIASNVHGKNHHKEGGFSNFVDELEIIDPKGKLVSASRDHNQDLFNTTLGGMGLTGIIISAKIRLKPITSSYIRMTSVKARNLAEMMRVFEGNKNCTYTMAWIDTLQASKSLGRGIVMLGEHASANEVKKPTLKNELKQLLTIPFYFPGWMLNRLTIKIFNLLYYGKQLKRKADKITHYDPFFYPLDSIHDWNKMYGKRGFIQYQAVIPLSKSKEGIKELLLAISKSRFGSFLAVLKLMGKEDNDISFPMEGYTLALDFPIKEGLFDFLVKLDAIVIHHGGRIYLSKDARMSKETFFKTYRWKELKNLLNEIDPNDKFQSFLSHRLELKGS